MSATLMHPESSQHARERAFSMPLEQIDVSDPALFENDTVGFYMERLRRDAPVHRSHSPLFGDFWSVRFDCSLASVVVSVSVSLSPCSPFCP